MKKRILIIFMTFFSIQSIYAKDSCRLIDQQQSSEQAAIGFLALKKIDPMENVIGEWYHDWSTDSDNYVAILNVKDPSKSNLIKVVLRSDCSVKDAGIAGDKPLLLEHLVELTKKSIASDKTLEKNCESVNEEIAICNGNLYLRDRRTTSNLKRDIKKIQDYSDSSKTSPVKSAVPK